MTTQSKLKPRSWEELYQALTDFQATHGHCDVGHQHPDSGLKCFVAKLRRTRDELTDDQRKKLDLIGFDLATLVERQERVWDAKAARLAEFRKIYGHCNVPQTSASDAIMDVWSQELGAWVQHQRQQFRLGKLPTSRQWKLVSIGFQWSICPHTKEKDTTKDDNKWHAMYLQLVDFQHCHGHVNVSKPHRSAPQDYLKLSHWVSTQRAENRSGIIRSSRKKLLDKLGFVWKVDKGDAIAWDDYYQELCKFHKLHGHFNLPSKHKSFSWAHGQRRARRMGTITSEREEALNKIGFAWETKKRGWNMTSGTAERAEHDKRRREGFPTDHTGSRVAVYWSDDDEYYEGVVTKHQQNGTFHVNYDDGDSEWVTPGETKFKLLKGSAQADSEKVELVAKVSRGTRVAVWWPSEEEYFNATVMKICNDEKNPHYLWYDDGDSQQTNLLSKRFNIIEEDAKVL